MGKFRGRLKSCLYSFNVNKSCFSVDLKHIWTKNMTSVYSSAFKIITTWSPMRINIAWKKIWGLENCVRKQWGNKSYFYIASVFHRVSSWKLFLGGQPYTRPWPESVSEVSAECEFPARLIKINVMDELSSPTREISNSLKLVHTEVSYDWLPSTGKRKQPATVSL